MENNVNVNVADSRGNTGLFFAVANCKADIIPTLVSYGAKLDQFNGEGLTPLSLCLLSYLALKNDVSDWEKSFLPNKYLPPEEEDEVRKWYPNKSLLTLSSRSDRNSVVEAINIKIPEVKDKLGAKSLKIDPKAGETYLFDTSFPYYTESKKKAGPEATRRITLVGPDVTLECHRDSDVSHAIQHTIGILLDCGADPNLGEVPLPPLLLAVFTKDVNLVKRLLEADADPNILTEDDLTGLHIVASQKCTTENIDIAQVLLEYYCDPNLRCSPNHWPEQKVKLLGKNKKIADYLDYGKNPLHLLCMRKDFPTDECNYFEELVTLFTDHHINANDLYMGHSPLSLAVLVGNTVLVERLLNVTGVDPYLVLGYDMGNVLTLFILKRYEDVLPLEKSKAMLQFLVNAGVNPLRTVGEFENAIGFMDKEHEVIKVVEKGKKNKKGKDKKPKSGKGSKGKKKGKVSNQNILIEYLKELTRDTIIKYVQMDAVENLYNLVEDNMLDYDCVKVMAEFLTPDIAFKNLQVLFNYGRIKAARFDTDVCLQLIDFVDKYKRVVKAKKEKKGKGGSKKSKKTMPILPEPAPNYSEMIKVTDFTKMQHEDTLVKPGLDSVTKYQVCFHCLGKRNKALFHCPKCQYIYFCSEQCNKLNVKMKAQHFCNINFYKMEKTRWESGIPADQETLQQLCKKALENCGERFRKRQQEELEVQRKKLEEERKLDIYGTKFLKYKKTVNKGTCEGSRRFTIASLCGSTSSSLGNFHKQNRILSKQLTKLSIFEDKYTEMLLQRTDSSLKRISVLPPKNFTVVTDRLTTKKEHCRYEDDHISKDTEIVESKKPRYLTAKNVEKKVEEKKIYKENVVSKFEAMEILPEPKPILRKLRKIPSKYQYFIELLSQYFPGEDLSCLFLPYSCFSNGHFYYKFLDDDIFARTYSMV